LIFEVPPTRSQHSFLLPTFPPSIFFLLFNSKNSTLTRLFFLFHSLPTTRYILFTRFSNRTRRRLTPFLYTLSKLSSAQNFEQCVPPLSSPLLLPSWLLPLRGKAPSCQFSRSETVRSRTQQHLSHRHHQPRQSPFQPSPQPTLLHR